MENKGYIYILTNPSFKEYVKIGYADNVENRLRQLNNSECTPFAFRVYATYEVEDRLTDVNLHKLIDQLNPNLRSIDNVNGKKRVREFYAMSPEQAYSILESIALLGGRKNRLKLWNVTEEERKDIEVAQEIEEEHIERLSPFAFSKCNIWQYEEEWRIICFLKNLNEQKLVENMISKVYLGANINEENEKLISELAKAKEVPVEKFKVSPETFELKIQIDG